MKDDEQEPALQPHNAAGGEESAWIIVDDMEDAPPGGRPDGPSETAVSDGPSATPQDDGWDFSTTTADWNAIPIAPPGTTSARAVESEHSHRLESMGRKGSASRADSTESTSGPDSSRFWQERFPDTVEGGAWFVDHGDDHLGDAPDGMAFKTTMGLPTRGSPSPGPGLVTFAVICLGALLVVLSIIWHPHTP